MQLMEALDYSRDRLLLTLNRVDEEKSTFTYAPDKWTIKTLAMHVTDADRIFQYRALSIARGEQENLPAFNENVFAENSNADEVAWSDIVMEFKLVADGMSMLFKNLHPTTLHIVGMANQTKLSAAQIGYISAGHRLHHIQVLQQKYFI
jgi:hypothetical protein